MKKSRFPGWLVAVIVIALLGVFGFSGYKAVSIWLQYRAANDEYADLRSLINQTAAPTDERSGTERFTGEATAATETTMPTASATPVAGMAQSESTTVPATIASVTSAPTDKPSAAATEADTTSIAKIAATTPPNGTAALSDESAPALAVSVAPTPKSNGAPTTGAPTGTAGSTTMATTAATIEPLATSESFKTPVATALPDARPLGEAEAMPEPLIQKDFAPLIEINEDAIGWITSEDTAIDYPIVQGDDNVFYLDHLFTGKWGFAGALFMDVDNMGDFSDQNSVVYGHHLNNGAMFASLSNYRNQAYYEEHPVMYLYTPTGDYEIQIFSGYARDASAIPHDFDAPEAFMAYIDQIKALSNFTSDVEVDPGDRIISLVTCTYVTNDARYVVHGKLVPLYGAERE